MKAYGGVRVYLPLYHQASSPQVLTGQEAGWTSGLYGKVKKLTLARNRAPTVQPVARRYTDSAIPAFEEQKVGRYINHQLN
jgi:hypothetical protein